VIAKALKQLVLLQRRRIFQLHKAARNLTKIVASTLPEVGTDIANSRPDRPPAFFVTIGRGGEEARWLGRLVG
jgi:hypothetical protein